MDKILIVGHQNSHYKTLEEILQIYGLSQSLNSYTHQMTPQQITTKLLKASVEKPVASISYNHKKHSTTVVNKQNYKTDDYSSNYVQKHPKKMWDNLAFDLLLANIDQPLWGWADEKAIELLEYWASFDEDMAFILTYDKPHDVLKKVLEHINLDGLDEQFIQSCLQDWAAYNQALLTFYKKHPERCMLVNGEQVVHSSQAYVESVAEKIAWQVDASQTYEITQLDTNLNKDASNQQVIDFFIEQVIAQHEGINEIFNTLQQHADISLITQHQTRNALTMLKTAILQQQDLSNTKQQNQHINNEVTNAQSQLAIYKKENSLIVEQLHQVQEDLEQYYLANKQSQKDLQAVNQAINKAKQETEYERQQVALLKQSKQKFEAEITKQKEDAQQAQTRLMQLENDLTKAQQQITSSTDTQQENSLLLTQLHQVQEELEKYYLENQRLKQDQNHQVSSEPIYYGAADRVKQDLPYRLGSTIVQHSKSPKELATLPFALAKEYRQFANSDLKDNLPDLNEYQDVVEAEKVKNQLSYKVGHSIVEALDSPTRIFTLPVKLGTDVISFKLKKNKKSKKDK